MKGVWFRKNSQVHSQDHSQIHPLIQSLCALDALEMAREMEIEEAIFCISHLHIIDAEESLDFLRLCQPLDLAIHIMLPLDPSVIQLASHLGCASLGIQVSIPSIEAGVQRSALLTHLLKDISIPTWGFGGLQAKHMGDLQNIGFAGCLLDGSIEFPVDDFPTVIWS